MQYKTTADIKVSKRIVDQIIGQEDATKIIKKASKQRRHVLLIGSPGTGKSLIGQALAELLPNEKLKDILSYPNQTDENVPLIREVSKGKGKQIVTQAKLQSMGTFRNQNILLFIFVIIASILPYYLYAKGIFPFDSPIVYAASMITSIVFIIGFMIFLNLSKKMGGMNKVQTPKLLLDNSKKKKAPFLEATGAHAGALLGDCLHDPLQCFFTTLKFKQNKKEKEIGKEIEVLLNKHKDQLITKEGYEAVFLDKNELKIEALKENKIQDVEVLSVNKHFKKDNLYKITTESGKELIITPEHKVAINKNNKIEFVEAQKINENDEVYTAEHIE